MLAIFWRKNETGERCKGVYCVDLGETFPTNIWLQSLASIQRRTSLVKFSGTSPTTDRASTTFWLSSTTGRGACRIVWGIGQACRGGRVAQAGAPYLSTSQGFARRSTEGLAGEIAFVFSI